jgi:RNA polymerase sigma-70 factor, ECF subfamily
MPTRISSQPRAADIASWKADPDVQLMERVRDGEMEAFETLFRKYGGLLVNHAYQFVRSRERAEEIAQTAFLQLYRARHRYEPRAGFLAYLYRITTNVCLNEMRCREYSKTIESLNAPLENGSGGWDAAPSRIADAHSLGPIGHLVGVSLAAKVQKVLDRLPLNQRAAFLLGRVGGLSYRDVAESLQTSVSAVKSLIFRATSTLRNELQDVL